MTWSCIPCALSLQTYFILSLQNPWLLIPSFLLLQFHLLPFISVSIFLPSKSSCLLSRQVSWCVIPEWLQQLEPFRFLTCIWSVSQPLMVPSEISSSSSGSCQSPNPQNAVPWGAKPDSTISQGSSSFQPTLFFAINIWPSFTTSSLIHLIGFLHITSLSYSLPHAIPSNISLSLHPLLSLLLPWFTDPTLFPSFLHRDQIPSHTHWNSNNLGI